jgi:hypothetical protein
MTDSLQDALNAFESSCAANNFASLDESSELLAAPMFGVCTAVSRLVHRVVDAVRLYNDPLTRVRKAPAAVGGQLVFDQRHIGVAGHQAKRHFRYWRVS